MKMVLSNLLRLLLADTMDRPNETDVKFNNKRSRGVTKKPQIAKNRSRGIKEIVQYNKKGQPHGKEHTDLESTLGMLARTTVPITYNDWREVPEDFKHKMWDYVEKSFVVDHRSRKNIISSIGIKFRSFKHALTKYHIIPFMNDPEHLKNPPDLYNFIQKEHWDKFVASQVSDEFQALRKLQQERRDKHIYNHRLGRQGYVGLELKIKDELGSSDDDELDRSELWKRARQMTNGLFDPATQAIVDKIDELTKQSKLGMLDKIVGDQDILTQSLGTPEHCGRVRGVGKFVTPTNYFHTPQAPADWNKREKFYCQRLAALEETVKVLSQQQPPTPHSDVSSNNVRKKVVYNAQVKETFAAVVEKRVDKDQTCQLALVSKDNVVATGTILEYGTPNVLVVIEVVLDPDALLPFQIDECLVNVKDGVGHHVLWPKEFVLPTVPKGEKGKDDIEKVPLSHKDEKTLKKGPNKIEKTPFTDNSLLEIQKTLPKIHTTLPKILKTSPNIKQTSPKMESSKPIQTPITNVKRPLKNPDSIEVFMKFAMRCVTKDSTFQVNFDDDTFGYHFYIFLTKEDLTCLTSMLELTVSCIILYMRQLYDHMKDEGLLETFGFINPAIVSLAGNLNNQRKRDERSRNIADRLVKANKNQLIIMPYNPAFHWILIVIDFSSMTVYYLDPLRNDIYEDVRVVVDNGVRIFHSGTKQSKRVNLKWITVKAPVQPGMVECGYYVMKYMKDIIADQSILCNTFNGKETYNEDEINQVHSEWTAYVSQFI